MDLFYQEADIEDSIFETTIDMYIESAISIIESMENVALIRASYFTEACKDNEKEVSDKMDGSIVKIFKNLLIKFLDTLYKIFKVELSQRNLQNRLSQSKKLEMLLKHLIEMVWISVKLRLHAQIFGNTTSL